MAIISNNVEQAALLLNSEVIAIPTETVYGLAANALNPSLVAKIFEIKQRPSFDPLIVHVKDVHEAEKYISYFPHALRKLANKFWPGALTLLLPRNKLIPDIVTSGLDRVGVRVPSHPLTQQLLSKIAFPLAAPSANPFGYISPSCAAHVDAQLGKHISFILDGGPCDIGIESTIVGMENEQVVIYRLGGISPEQIQALGIVPLLKLSEGANPAAPGMLHQHYAPRKRLFFTANPLAVKALHQGLKMSFITFNKAYLDEFEDCFDLSNVGDYREAAANLFAAMRKADASSSDIIIALQLPEHHLGRAINDRLKRAAF
jgi:L-threonylcarbamoyladenylate synthase